MEARLFALQRITAIILAPLVLIHLAGILYAVEGGLTAGEILARTRGNHLLTLFYGVFVLCVSIHGAIGLRNILIEWAGMPRRIAMPVMAATALVLLALGMRAVVAVS